MTTAEQGEGIRIHLDWPGQDRRHLGLHYFTAISGGRAKSARGKDDASSVSGHLSTAKSMERCCR